MRVSGCGCKQRHGRCRRRQETSAHLAAFARVNSWGSLNREDTAQPVTACATAALSRVSGNLRYRLSRRVDRRHSLDENLKPITASAASNRLLITLNLFVFQDNCRAGAQLKFVTAVTFRSRLEPGSVRRAVQFISKKRLTVSKNDPAARQVIGRELMAAIYNARRRQSARCRLWVFAV